MLNVFISDVGYQKSNMIPFFKVKPKNLLELLLLFNCRSSKLIIVIMKSIVDNRGHEILILIKTETKEVLRSVWTQEVMVGQGATCVTCRPLVLILPLVPLVAAQKQL